MRFRSDSHASIRAKMFFCGKSCGTHTSSFFLNPIFFKWFITVWWLMPSSWPMLRMLLCRSLSINSAILSQFSTTGLQPLYIDSFFPLLIDVHFKSPFWSYLQRHRFERDKMNKCFQKYDVFRNGSHSFRPKIIISLFLFLLFYSSSGLSTKIDFEKKSQWNWALFLDSFCGKLQFSSYFLILKLNKGITVLKLVTTINDATMKLRKSL